ncbi:hypothetical protein FRC10_005907 [Ceratobasidium sp. 414]|nr:hypothetical protein FRC10_005907 [Ceratobasidium sp. 414]
MRAVSMSSPSYGHAAFVLLAEFDIDQGSVLTHQYPHPMGIDEQFIAEMMIPDGVHDQKSDWTIFFLNQVPANTVTISLIDDTPAVPEENSQLLYVLNLVRTVKNPNARRNLNQALSGANVKALALCTPHPYLHVFKPILTMALDDYFVQPDVQCLARLFDAVNAIDISRAPVLSRDEMLIMRATERKDVFAEKFFGTELHADIVPRDSRGMGSIDLTSATTSLDGFETDAPTTTRSRKSSLTSDSAHSHSPPTSLGLKNGGSNEDVTAKPNGEPTPRTSLDRMSVASSVHLTNRVDSSSVGHGSIAPVTRRIIQSRNTHFYTSFVRYPRLKESGSGHLDLPVNCPLSTFPEEVGDFSLIKLINTFSNSNPVAGPITPHLHPQGAQTHPLVVLFNALVTQQRIIFLGQRCAAGASNPVFETVPIWDVLCNINTGRITVHKDIRIPSPPPPLPSVSHASPVERFGQSIGSSVPATAGIGGAGAFPPPPNLAPKTGVLRAEDEDVRVVGESRRSDGAESSDSAFMEDICAVIHNHAGELLVRARITDYVQRFVRIAARWEEDVYGATTIDHPSRSFSEGALGSGATFADEALISREMVANSWRIAAWRETSDFAVHLEERAIQDVDINHLVCRLRNGRNMSHSEAETIARSLWACVQTYEQVVELLALLPPHHGGLTPLCFGLFHSSENIRDMTVDFMTILRTHNIGVQFLTGLNYFHRFGYVRLAQLREISSARPTNGSTEGSGDFAGGLYHLGYSISCVPPTAQTKAHRMDSTGRAGCWSGLRALFNGRKPTQALNRIEQDGTSKRASVLANDLPPTYDLHQTDKQNVTSLGRCCDWSPLGQKLLPGCVRELELPSPEAADTSDHAIEKLDSALREVNLKIHDHPELAWDVKYAHDVLTDFLEEHDFTVTRHHLADQLPGDTAWKGEFIVPSKDDSSLRVVGFNSEMDALPGVGHACGHNLIAVAGIAAALGLKAAMEKHQIPGKIIILGTPAEEGGSGKVFLLRAGAYQEMDVCMMAHPSSGDHGNSMWTWTGGSLAIQSFSVEYHGQTAHAGAAPWEGKNALDAAFIAYAAISALRQQIHPTMRVHGMIEGRDWAPNSMFGGIKVFTR